MSSEFRTQGPLTALDYSLPGTGPSRAAGSWQGKDRDYLVSVVLIVLSLDTELYCCISHPPSIANFLQDALVQPPMGFRFEVEGSSCTAHGLELGFFGWASGSGFGPCLAPKLRLRVWKP